MGNLPSRLGNGVIVAIVGGSSRLGRDVAGLLSSSYRVVSTYNKRNPAGACNNLREILGQRLDVTSENDIDAFVSFLEDRKEPIALVYMACHSEDKIAQHCSQSDLALAYEVNCWAAIAIAKKVAPLMIKRSWGRLVFVSSITSRTAPPGTIAYAASKSALETSSRVLSREYARFGITSNVIRLGYMSAGLAESLSVETIDKIRSSIPTGRLGSPDNVAHAIRFIIDADYVNGAILPIDGGI